MADLARKTQFDWDKVFSDLEHQLKGGQAKLVRDELRKYPSEVVPTEWWGRFASLARRSGIPGIAIKTLHPLLRLANGKLVGGFHNEKAEYAASLIELGVFNEALDILEHLDADKNLDLFLLKSRVLLLHRNYKAILFPMEQLVRQHYNETTPQVYQAKIEFATALVQQGLFDQADVLLEDLIDTLIEPEQGGWRGAALLLAGQANLLRKRNSTAERFIYSAQAVLKGRGAIHELQARKWVVICNLVESGGAETERTELKKVRSAAKELGMWESIRDCDKYEAITMGNEEQLLHLYFGSPFPYYQKRLLSDFGQPIRLPEYYYRAFDPVRKSEEIVDVQTGEVTRDVGAPEVQHLPGSFVGHADAQKVFATLSSDFYAPFSYGALWSALFSSAPFHPKDSLLKVKGMVAELENWLMEQQIKIEIKTEKNAFFLASSQAISLKVK